LYLKFKEFCEAVGKKDRILVFVLETVVTAAIWTWEGRGNGGMEDTA